MIPLGTKPHFAKTRPLEEQPRRKNIWTLLQENNIISMENIEDLFKETIAEFMKLRWMNPWSTAG